MADDDLQPRFMNPPAPAGVNVINPQGQTVSIPQEQMQDAISNQGYTMPDSTFSAPSAAEQAQQDQYGGAGQAVIAGLEGAANQATFGLAPKIETGLGLTTNEAIQGRRQANPVVEGVLGQGLGAATFTALAPELEAAKALGLAGSGLGSIALRSGIDFAAFQGKDEIAKALSEDPGSSAETAIANIGSAGLTGAVAGPFFSKVVSPLWEATGAPALRNILGTMKASMGGIDASTSAPARAAMDTLGVTDQLPPTSRAILSEDPNARLAGSILDQTDTNISGLEYQKQQQAAANMIDDKIVESLGSDSKSLATAPEFSPAQAGKELGQSIADGIESRYAPTKDLYAQVADQAKDIQLKPDEITSVRTPESAANPHAPLEYANTVVNPGDMNQVVEDVAKLANEKGYFADPESPPSVLVQRIMKSLPNLDTLDAFHHYASRIGAETFGDVALKDVGRNLKQIFMDASERITDANLTPEVASMKQAADAQYRPLKVLISDLNDRLNVGADSYKGPQQFINNLKDAVRADSEGIFKKLTAPGHSDLLNTMNTELPEAAQTLKQHFLDKMLQDAADKAKPDSSISLNSILRKVGSLSPEEKAFYLPEGAAAKIDAAQTLHDRLQDPTHNFSNTARTVDKLGAGLTSVGGGPYAMASYLMGKSPVVGFLLGNVAKALQKDAPDAARMTILKYLGSSKPVDAGAFKSTVEFFDQLLKGNNRLSKAVGSVFGGGAKAITSTVLDQKDLDKFDKKVASYQTNPQAFFQLGGTLGHYAPDHSTSFTEASSRTINYLNSIRPTPTKASPLDSEAPINPVQKATYNQALRLADNPTSILADVKDGTITHDQIQHLAAMYPAYYKKMASQTQEAMTEYIADGGEVPYHTRMGLSLFLAQPLDSTMTPQAIQMNQQALMAPAPQSQSQGPQTQSGQKHSMNSLSKLVSMDQTPIQQRLSAKAS